MTDDGNVGELPPGFVLSDEQHGEWVSFAYTARSCELVLKRLSEPKSG